MRKRPETSRLFQKFIWENLMRLVNVINFDITKQPIFLQTAFSQNRKSPFKVVSLSFITARKLGASMARVFKKHQEK